MKVDNYSDFKEVKVAGKTLKKVKSFDGIIIDRIEIVEGDILIFDKEDKLQILIHGEPFRLRFFSSPPGKIELVS